MQDTLCRSYSASHAASAPKHSCPIKDAVIPMPANHALLSVLMICTPVLSRNIIRCGTEWAQSPIT